MLLSISIYILLAVNVVVCLLIIFTVLMQRPKSEGLGAAFGGGMTENLFGAQTTNVLANITRWLGGLFFVLTLTLSMLYARQSRIGGTPVEQQLLKSPPAPAATPAPAVPPGAESSPAPGEPAPAISPATSATSPAAPGSEASPAAVDPAQPAAETNSSPAAEAPATSPAAAPEASPAAP
jgi:preprotein translocase subunit SecG